ncbi:hypothetical protein C8R43DRAFT_1202242 [Mycena crocata]|nr:hypothetical protein C8R43DRAFT_1202242 [Mycena crocata]
MKIIIIGGGIGGIAAYHTLRKHLADVYPPVTVVVFESHESTIATSSILQSGLRLAPNGLRAVSCISQDAATYIEERGFRSEVTTFRNSKGALLGRFRAGRKAQYGIIELMLPRETVHEALVHELRPGAVQWGRKVRSVKENNDSVKVTMEDGTVETADLVIGADGARSIVREAIFGQRYDASYTNMMSVGGFIPMASLSESLRDSIRADPVTITFGAGGFFGYSPANRDFTDIKRGQLMWWSTYQTNDAPGHAHDTQPSMIQEQLIACHAKWTSPSDTPGHRIFCDIISFACADGNTSSRLVVLPEYIMPRLPHWSSLPGTGRILLLGDAAHAMATSMIPAHTAQDVSSTVEDAVAIALLLKHYLVSHRFNTEKSLQQTAKAYEAVRMKRVGKILDAMKHGGKTKKTQNWLQQKIHDWTLRISCHLPKSFNDRQFGYDIEGDIAKYIAKSHCEPKHLDLTLLF